MAQSRLWSRHNIVGMGLLVTSLMLAGCANGSASGGGSNAQSGAIAFLTPDTKVARYEAFDRPYFEAHMK